MSSDRHKTHMVDTANTNRTKLHNHCTARAVFRYPLIMNIKAVNNALVLFISRLNRSHRGTPAWEPIPPLVLVRYFVGRFDTLYNYHLCTLFGRASNELALQKVGNPDSGSLTLIHRFGDRKLQSRKFT